MGFRSYPTATFKDIDMRDDSDLEILKAKREALFDKRKLIADSNLEGLSDIITRTSFERKFIWFVFKVVWYFRRLKSLVTKGKWI